MLHTAMRDFADGVVDGGQPKKFLQPVLLLLLRESPAHGYDLLERLDEFGLEREPGGLYRNLRAMEHRGLVASSWEASFIGPDRRRYELTPVGERWLDAWASTLDETRRVLDVFLSRIRVVDLAREDA